MTRRFLIICVVAALVPMGRIGAFDPLFYPARMDFIMGYATVRDAVLVDLNQDGYMDIAGETFSGSSHQFLSIMINAGDGSFGEPAMLETSNTPHGLAAADFSGDGYPDVAVVSGDDLLEIFINDGAAGFGSPAYYAVGMSPAALWCGDLNADGQPDIAVAAEESDSVSVLINAGSGNFAQSVSYSAPDNPVDITGADFDGDGDTDLALANENAEGVTILKNAGDGTFENYIHTVSGGYSCCIEVLDADADGDPDIAVALADEESIGFLLNQGDGTFSAGVPVPVGWAPGDLSAMDVNSDGRPDLAVAGKSAGTVSVLLNKAPSPFTEIHSYRAIRPVRVLCGDLDHDGISDLVAASNPSEVSPEAFSVAVAAVFYGTGDGSFRDTPAEHCQDNFSSVAVADFNEDSLDDLVFSVPGRNVVTVYISVPDGGFDAPESFPGGSGPEDVIVSDFNSDGHADLATANRNSGDVSILPGNGDGTFQPPSHVACGESPFQLATGAFAGGADPDLAVLIGSMGDDKTVAVLENDGTGGFSLKETLPTGSLGLSFLAADLDGDSDSDLAVLDYWGIRVMINDGESGFSDPAVYGIVESASWEMAAADVDNDGDLDIAVPDLAGMIEIFKNQGDGTFNEFTSGEGNTGSAPIDIVIADFDRDSDPDFAVASRTCDSVAVLLNSGTGHYGWVNYFYGSGAGPYRMACGDLNGDNWPDLAICYLNEPGFSVLTRIGDFPPPTPTPVPDCTITGVTIELNATVFTGGDPFTCGVSVCNADPGVLSGYPLFVILECSGEYFFAPSFSPDLDDFSEEYPEFPVGETRVPVVEFTWPAVPGSGSAVWYAALTDPAVQFLYGDMDTVEFGWDG